LALSRRISRLATSSFQSIRAWLSIYATRSLLILLPFKVGNGQSLVSVSNTIILMAQLFNILTGTHCHQVIETKSCGFDHTLTRWVTPFFS
jgi:hypothetical protein